MRISLEWISQYVDLTGLSPEAIADGLTMKTAEVEGMEKVVRALSGVVAGRVVSVRPIKGHPDLRLADVDCGSDVFRTVCGAPNVRVGLRSAFARVGAVLKDGRPIARTEVAGEPSGGVLCSPLELGLSDVHESIIELPPDIENGRPLAELVPLEDVLLEIDNKSLTHRPDLWGCYGMAREIAAMFGRDLRPLQVDDLGLHANLPEFPLQLDDTDGCVRYCCMVIDGLAAVASPLPIQSRLYAVGQRPLNIIVDLTNYIMFELAQPMHSFSADGLAAIRVARMGRQAAFHTLDGVERALQPDDLMIWDARGNEPIAVAGVMGGMNTEISADTSRIVLESATFRGSRVRRTSARLGLRTDASQRFEKNQPPANASLAIARFMRLLRDAGQQPIARTCLTSREAATEARQPIVISMDYLHKRVGAPIPRESVRSILASLGFEVACDGDNLAVRVPPHRSTKDISIPEDVIEEVARIHGYDKIASVMPRVAIAPAVPDDSVLAQRKFTRFLAAAHGFSEVNTYSWFDDSWLEAVGYTPEQALVIANPTSERESRLRTTLIPNLLAVVKANVIQRDSLRVFELGHVYGAAADNPCDERPILAGVSYIQKKRLSPLEHFQRIRGVVEDLMVVANPAEPWLVKAGTPDAPWKAQGECVDVECGGRIVGALGTLPARLLRVVAPQAHIVWFELEVGQLKGTVYPEMTYSAPSPYPASWFDFSILWEAGKSFEELDRKISRFAHPLFTKREFLYYYEGAESKGVTKSYTFRYWVGASDRTLSRDELSSFREAFLQFIASEGLALR